MLACSTLASSRCPFLCCPLQNRNTEYCAPLTSFDWNELDPSFVGACSIDTTCTIWDLNVRKVKTQLIAHDKEVYDIAWSPRQVRRWAAVAVLLGSIFRVFTR